jgi:hypothetical protein
MMEAQTLYEYRTKYEFCSGQDLSEFFREFVGSPSPTGQTNVNADEADEFVCSSIEAMAWNSPSLEDHCHSALEAWTAIMRYEEFSVQREDENLIVLCVPWDATEKEVLKAANHMRPVIGGWRLSGSPGDCKYSEDKFHFHLQKE